MYYVVSASSFACRFFNINIAWDLRKDTNDFSDITRQDLLEDKPGDAEYLAAFNKVAPSHSKTIICRICIRMPI